jgi:hypothetical protein
MNLFPDARRVVNFACPILFCFLTVGPGLSARGGPDAFSEPQQNLERTCFQTHAPWQADCDLRSDVAIVYGLMTAWRRASSRGAIMATAFT